MSVKEITKDIFCVTLERKENGLRFEGIWEIPTGVTLNSYIVRDEKICLIDTVLENAGDELCADLKSIDISFSKIDYIVLNHVEPDHSGFIIEAVKENPNVEIFATEKGANFIKKFFKINAKIHAITNGGTLSLGKKTLQFFEAMNVHWPETMMTFCVEERVLFSCDCFGGYGTFGGKILESENTNESLENYKSECLRYYANIMASFNSFVTKAIEKLSEEIKIICPSHGILWNKNPRTAISLYEKYARYGNGEELENEVCVIWASMYGYTKTGVDAVVRGLEKRGARITMLRIPETPQSYVLEKAYKAKALLLAMPTYEYKMFPPMAHILDLFERKRFIKKTVLRIGNWGWIGGAKREYDARIENMQWNNLPSYEWQGVLSACDISNLEKLGEQLAGN